MDPQGFQGGSGGGLEPSAGGKGSMGAGSKGGGGAPATGLGGARIQPDEQSTHADAPAVAGSQGVSLEAINRYKEVNQGEEREGHFKRSHAGHEAGDKGKVHTEHGDAEGLRS